MPAIINDAVAQFLFIMGDIVRIFFFAGSVFD